MVIVAIGEVPRGGLQLAGQQHQDRGQAIGDNAGFHDPGVGATLLLRPVGQIAHQFIQREIRVADELLLLAQLQMHQQTLIGLFVVQAIQEILDLPAADARPEMGAGHVLQRMGFVQDRDVIVGQDRRMLGPERQIGEEQSVVDHQDLRRARRAAWRRNSSSCRTSSICGPGSCFDR